jgi:hypothetical protein
VEGFTVATYTGVRAEEAGSGSALDFSSILRHEVTKGFFFEDELFGVSFHS